VRCGEQASPAQALIENGVGKSDCLTVGLQQRKLSSDFTHSATTHTRTQGNQIAGRFGTQLEGGVRGGFAGFGAYSHPRI
jgi:hypothetical protein